MRVVLLSVLLIFGWVVESGAQMRQPLREKPGRVRRLERVVTITDEQGGFYFRYPRKLKPADDGSIYILELSQLLRFDKEGKLLQNFHRVGEGPGEFTMLGDFIVNGEMLVAYNTYPAKLIRFHINGTFIREDRINPESRFGRILLYRDDKYYVVGGGMPPLTPKPKIVDIDYDLLEYTGKFDSPRKLTSLPVRQYVMSRGQERRAYQLGNFIVKVHQGRYFIISHEPAYRVRVFDIEENRFILDISRKYKRVKWYNKKWAKDKVAPKIEFEPDIKNILALKDEIWLVTSTVDKKRGTLVDVFDYRGRYLDYFYIPLKGEIMANREREIFVKEAGTDLNVVIVHYRIKNQ